MGQKVNPHALRVGVVKDWNSKWYDEDDNLIYLIEDDGMKRRMSVINWDSTRRTISKARQFVNSIIKRVTGRWLTLPRPRLIS